MKQFSIILLCMVLPMSNPVFAQEGIDDLAEFRWQNRIILVQNVEECSQARKTLGDVDLEVQDRDVFWFAICAGELSSNYAGSISKDFIDRLRSRYFKSSEDAVVLIGKDGGVKSRSSNLNTSEIFNLIDSMPMRQNEMRRK